MADASPVERVLRARIEAEGPLPFSEVMQTALYDPEHGFYMQGGQAGRRGDFLTSPEVGPLFGACVGVALDRWWVELGRPSPFTVVEAGAGPGTLARSIQVAAPACAESLRYVAVETSGDQRRMHPSGVESCSELPADEAVDVVIANELLDNLAFDLYDFDPDRGWAEVRVGAELTEVLVPTDHRPLDEPPDRPVRVPGQARAQAWLDRALAAVPRGVVVVIDYVRRYPAPDDGWLRTYHDHGRGLAPLDRLGGQDITADVDLAQLEQIRPPDRLYDQAEWLDSLGIEALVDEGRREWAERAAVADLAAIRARSRVREAEALLDPAGLGAFTVLEWRNDLGG